MRATRYLEAQIVKVDRLVRTQIDGLAAHLLQAMAQDYPRQADRFAGYIGSRTER